MPSVNAKYFVYKDEIISLHNQGVSGDTIARILSEKYKDQSLANAGRQIRRRIAEWTGGREGNTGKKRMSKILFFDLETAPMKAFVWGKWGVDIPDDFIIEDWFVFCWSAKWLWDDKIISMSLTKKEVKQCNDKRIMKGLWNLFDEADIIVAHNLDKFDEKRSKTRFLKYDMGLPSPYQKVDTLKVLRRNFNITSNRLDYVAKRFLGIDGKMETEKGLWQRVYNNDDGAMEAMVLYCEQDIRVLEDVYMYIRKYHRQHPNIALIEEDTGSLTCKTCGHDEVEECGEHRTMVNAYTAYRCKDCGSISYGRKGQVDKDHAKNILK
jgi:predicted RNA-binding Zn-ribbon protein involved in translation (DUF1610 family)